MFAAVDVQYVDPAAAAACILFRDWQDAAPAESRTILIDKVTPYVPGRFFERELPPIVSVLKRLDAIPDILLIDGHVWLSYGQPGLGAHLFEALGGTVPVIGVAKNPFAGNDAALPVLRATSKHPLYVTAAGCDQDEAAGRVAAMHGDSRIPTLLKCVDTLCRDAAKSLKRDE